MSPTETARQISSDALERTNVTASLESGLTPGRNLICCAAFQLAWNQLIDEIVKAPVQLEGNPTLVQALNKRCFDQRDVSEDCCLAMAGFGRDGVVEQVEVRLKEKFHRETGSGLTVSSPDDIVAYAYLEKSLPFDTIFDVFAEPLLFSDGMRVRSFGITKNYSAADQVAILDYRGRDDFILRLQGSPSMDDGAFFGLVSTHPRITDEIILAKVTPAATLLETVDAVFYRISERGRREAAMAGLGSERVDPRLDAHAQETLQIPIINFNIEHRFAEIVGRHLLNGSFERYLLRDALLATRFKLDETGADLASEGRILASYGVPEEPRQFIFDKPFLLCLREKQASHPYLAVWIGNSELLVRAS